MTAVAVIDVKGEPRVDTRLLATQLMNQHRPVMALIDKYEGKFEQFGKVLFQKAASTESRTGQQERFAMLNEDQSYFLLSLSRNTDHVVDLKANLVKAFSQARAGQHATAVEYLPGYHELHDKVHQLANGSTNERHVHTNVNKLINKTVGIAAGQRQTIASSTKAAVVVAQTLAINAMSAANDHHDGYQAAKAALGNFEQLLLGRRA